MWQLILRKEITSSLRDFRIQIAGGFLIILMLLAVFIGRQGQEQIRQQRAEAQAEMYGEWVNQGEKHPHSAAHYGQFAFKPKPVLSFFDLGLDNYTGVSVFLEAHRQHDILFTAAQDSNGMSRFGEMTAAMVLQVLFPLLIIFLTFNTFSGEREEGTLKLLHAQGVPMSQLLLGKALSTYILVLLIFVPVVVMAYVLLQQGSTSVDPGVGAKFVGLAAMYAWYFLVIVLAAALISALTRNSTISLLSLLGLWIAACTILPKATSNLADKAYATPSQFEFRQVIREKVRNGIDGHNASDARLDDLKQTVLAEYGVNTIEELPVNWSGIAMQAGEEYTDMVYDQEFSRVERIFIQQNRISEWMGFIDPYLAVRNLSMALSGTDFHHHIAFARAAENYRRAFVKKMNKDMELNHKPGVEYSDYNVGVEMWASVDPFVYELPSLGKILAQQWRGLLSLGIWLAGLLLAVRMYAPKVAIL